MVTKAQPVEVFNGALLSDAHVASNYGSPYFKIAQAGEDRMQWLNSIAESLSAMGIEIASLGISDRINHYTKREYRCCELVSRAHPLIKAARAEWYPDGIKRIPVALVITSGTLANWFMGDGSSTRLKGREWYVKASLCTQSFPDEDVVLLAIKLLEQLGIKSSHNRVSKINGKGLVLNIAAVDEVNRLMGTVEPYVLPPYLYKVKRAFFDYHSWRSSLSTMNRS